MLFISSQVVHRLTCFSAASSVETNFLYRVCRQPLPRNRCRPPVASISIDVGRLKAPVGDRPRGSQNVEFL